MRQPSQTLYCNNLNDQITKQDLRRSLFHLFSQFGTVIDVVALKTPRMRGQAWVVFDQTMAATNALRQLQGFPFHNKPIRIDYAKTESDAVARTKKGYIPRYKRKKQIGPAKPEDDTDSESATKRLADAASGGGGGGGGGGGAAAAAAAETGEEQKPMTDTGAAANRKIIASELPPNCTGEQLAILFRQYRGFEGARAIEGKRVAFIDFENTDCATLALERLQGFRLTPTHVLHLQYAK